MPLSKPGSKPASSSGQLPLTPAGTTLAAFPTLWEFLTHTTWADASRRQTGTILLFVDSGTFKACLKDKNGSRVCFVSGNGVDDVLLAVEHGLDQDTLDWRPDRPQAGRR